MLGVTETSAVLEIPAKTVYVDPAVRERANCRQRLERLLPYVRCDDIRDLGETWLNDIRAIGHRRHGKDDFAADAVVAFTTFEEDRLGWYYHLRDAASIAENHGGQCQTAIELNIVQGCVFRCAYCGFGRYILFSLDVERLVDGLDTVFSQRPRQRLYKYSNMTDLPPFEPEYDAVAPMIRRFAREDGRYLMLFTKSDHVDWLLDLDHNGRTIISWSLSSDTASREVDRRAATLGERIEAMRRCERAGYLVRARLSPIVPVRHWREEYRELFERLFAACRPDVVTLELLGWFDFDDLPKLISPRLLDAEAYAAAEAAREALRGRRDGPFTRETHETVYRFCIETVAELSPGTPVAICHGTPDIWRSLGAAMGMTPERYICNCGPNSTPGGELYDALHARRGEADPPGGR
jgi:hypothetical protein